MASSSRASLAFHPPWVLGGRIVRRAGVLAAALGIVATGAVSVAAARHDAPAGPVRPDTAAALTPQQLMVTPPTADEIEWP